MNAFVLLSLFLSIASAQLLTNGNSQLPSCAATCTLLNQAAQACGGTATADQAIWECFCQSGYLTSLYSSPNGICDQFCTNPSDNQQVQTWYKSNCGTDKGASEHSGTTPSSSSAAASSSTAPASTSSGVASSTATSTAAGAGDVTSATTPEQGGWWHNHWKWVLMIIVIAVGLILLTIIAVCLKRRHNKKRDLIREGFNAGITSRTTPMATTTHVNDSHVMSAAGALENNNPASGRASPARTRDAFMPYGYGYTRSESRLAGTASPVGGGRASPLARGGTPVNELEKDVGIVGGGAETPTSSSGGGGGSRKLRRIPVRERSGRGQQEDIIENYSEKGVS